MEKKMSIQKTTLLILFFAFIIFTGTLAVLGQDQPPAVTPSGESLPAMPPEETAAPPKSSVGVVTLSELDLNTYPIISAYLSLTDPDGRPINIINIKDLSVTEEGMPVSDLKVIEADPVTDPLSVVLAIDISGSMAGSPLDEAKRAAEAFVKLLEPGDKAALVTFDQEVYKNVSLTDDKDALIAAIRALKHQGDTALYQAVIDSASILKSAPEGRRIIIILTDGKNDKASTAATKEDSVGAAGAARAVVLTIGLGRDIQKDVLTYIAEESGGRFFHAINPRDLEAVYTLISEQIHAQYRISFISPFPERPDRVVLFHTIAVSLKYGGETITGGREFLASTNPPLNTGALIEYEHKEKTAELWQTLFYAFVIVAFALVLAILTVLIVKAARARR